MEYYSAIKRNTYEPILMRWMILEPIIQSEVRKKKINIVYKCIYMASRKMVPNNLFSGQQWRNRHREQTYGHWGREEGEGEMYGERNMELTLPYVT